MYQKKQPPSLHDGDDRGAAGYLKVGHQNFLVGWATMRLAHPNGL